jgi:glycosyltransferase involved in cell wall biosynthesis
VKILYVAVDQTVPGTTGGSVHVSSVAEGLAALGHEVHALANVDLTTARGEGRVRWHQLSAPFGWRQLRIVRGPAVRALAATLKPDAIIERYYNFGGESVGAARATGALLALEVNAPVIDYPGSPKERLDRALLVEPMRRWREWQCRAADLIITPSAKILPAFVPAERVLEIEWGADTVRFHPGARGRVPFSRRSGDTVVVFAGAFRPWHGAIQLVTALRQLHSAGRTDITGVFVGDGPEKVRVQEAAAGLKGIVFTGPVAHEHMPACLAAADIGVAPFDVAAHAPLALDFYWSPLKIFEYMSSGLPVVAPDIARLRRIVTDEREGLLYDAGDPQALGRALVRLAGQKAGRDSTAPPGNTLRTRLGAAARTRACQEFGWDVHCRELDRALRQAADRRGSSRCES